MNDYDNLPTSATPLDAFNAGVSKWDDPHIAWSKLMVHDLENANALQRQQDSAAAAAASISPGLSTTPFVGSSNQQIDYMRYIYDMNRMSVVSLAREIEGERLQLVAKREKAAKPARQLRRVAIVGFLITAWLVLFSFKLPFIPAKYQALEYFGARIGLIASIWGIFAASSRIAKTHDPEEKRVETRVKCLVQAIKESGGFPKAGSQGLTDTVLLGKFRVPRRDLTPQFLLALNAALLKATGEPMPYSLYRFREKHLWQRGIFIPYGSVPDKYTAQVCDPISLEELKQLIA